MRLIDRLYNYLKYKEITPRAFERSCALSNGYLHKQSKGKGSVGSDILEKIHRVYFDLSLIWLITGEGTMLIENKSHELQEEKAVYLVKDELIDLLKEQVQVLERSNTDKNKIIALLEKQLGSEDHNPPSA